MNKPQITFDLDVWVKQYLGDEHSRSIDPALAEIVEIKAAGTFICYIEWPGEYRPDLAGPVMWYYPYWAASQERWEIGKKRSHDERVQRFLLEANIKTVSRAIREFFLMDEGRAHATAFTWVKNKQINKIKLVGVDKLKEKEEEL